MEDQRVTRGAGRWRHKSNKIRRQPVAGDTIVNNLWMASNDKEGSGQRK